MKNNNKNPTEEEIPGMEIDRKYSVKKTETPQGNEEIKKEMEKTKKDLDKLKDWVVKKYPSTLSIGVLPPQSLNIFIEEEEVPKETEKHLHLYMIVPEEQFKKIPDMKKEIVKQIDSLKTDQKIWLQIKTPVDIWEACLDSKFDLSYAIAMSMPIYDKGFLGALRFTQIHRSLVLQKFEKYVVSYVVVGSFIRGEATKTSDVDVAIIINDTDVKKMPRLELKERLRGIVHQFVPEAAQLAGVKNTLHIQTYLLTDFWESVKDASPVIFTFIRDGVPIYDRGTFMPWKALLKMGKLKPSPESIDMFMKTADKAAEMVNRRLIDAMIDVYYSVLNPSQALIMLSGNAPPTHRETVTKMEEIFVKKEKLLKKTDIAILDKAVKEFKKYEHDLKYKITGKELDKMMKETEVYLKKLKELRKDIEKRSDEKTIEQIYNDVFALLKEVTGEKAQDKIIHVFENLFVKKGKFSPLSIRILNNIVSARKEFKKGKLNTRKVDEARRDAQMLIKELVEYNQRVELASRK